MRKIKHIHTSDKRMHSILRLASELHARGYILEAYDNYFKAVDFAPKRLPIRHALESNLIRNAELQQLLGIKDSERHDATCIRRRIADALYEQEWPNSCKVCGATGVVVGPGCSVPYGSTNVNLPDEEDLCPECEEKGLCPRCAGPRVWDEVAEAFLACPTCGFHNDKLNGDPTPGRPLVDCYCEEAAFYAKETNPFVAEYA